MDDSVQRAMANWPNVPAVYGYIGLDRRGGFWLQGHRVTHQRTARYIARNYALDDQGRAFFQNGPQRAYADLEATPWVYRVHDHGELRCHTDTPVAALRGAWLTPDGTVVLTTEHGPGIVHDQDLGLLLDNLAAPDGGDPTDALDALQAGAVTTVHLCLGADAVTLGLLANGDLARQFGFDRQPEPGDDPRAAVSDWRPAWQTEVR